MCVGDPGRAWIGRYCGQLGERSNPSWCHNLVAHPRVRVVVNGRVIDDVARVLHDEEAEAGFELALSLNPRPGRFRRRNVRRTIPVVELTHVALTMAPGRRRPWRCRTPRRSGFGSQLAGTSALAVTSCSIRRGSGSMLQLYRGPVQSFQVDHVASWVVRAMTTMASEPGSDPSGDPQLDVPSRRCGRHVGDAAAPLWALRQPAGEECP